MSELLKLSNILKKLGIKKSSEYMVKNILSREHNIRKLVTLDVNGGSILEKRHEKKTEIKYKNNVYIFTSYHDGNQIFYHLHGKYTSCLTIIINKEIHTAILFEVNNDFGCFPDDEKEKTGSTLIKLAIKLINKIKDKYNIDKIELQDNSTKKCGDKKGSRLNFSKMSILIAGDTWYGKYNFLPYDENDNSATKRLIKKYAKNKKIMNTIKMKDVKDFKKILLDALKKTTITKTLENNILEFFDDCYDNNDLVKNFLANFLRDNFASDLKTGFDRTCIVFKNFYDKLFAILGLFDFQGKKFMMKI